MSGGSWGGGIAQARPHGMAYRNAADLAQAGRGGEEATSAARAVSQVPAARIHPPFVKLLSQRARQETK